jgi:hypothetical protein
VFRSDLTLGCHRLITADARVTGVDPTAEAAGSGHGRSWLALGEVPVSSSYSGQFSIRFAPTGSQRRGERVYANLNRRRAATKPDNGEAARPVLDDGEGGLR